MVKVRKKIEAKDLFSATIESTPDGILVVDSRGKIMFANKNLAEMWNIPRQLLCQNATKEALSFATSQLVDPKSFLDEIKRLKKFPQEKSSDIVQLKDGRVFERYSYPQKIGQEEKDGRVWSFRDVTRYKKAEGELNKQKIFFNSIVENLPDMIFVKDAKNLKFQLFNTAGEKLLGQKRKDLLGKSDYDFFPVSEADFFIKKDREVLKSGKLLDIPEEPIKTRGGQRFLHTKKIPLYDEKGKPEFLLGISEDITEKKKLEEELRAYTEGRLKEGEEKFRKIFDNTNDAIVIHNLAGKVLEVNNSACELLKYSKSEWLKLDETKVDSPEEIKKFPERVRKVLKNGSLLFETVHLTKDGERIPVEVNSKLINFLGQKAILSVIRNISERKESEEKFKSTINNVPGMVYLAGPDWFADVLSGSQEICGYSPEDFKLKKVNWLNLIYPDDKKGVFEEGAVLSQKKTSLIQTYRIIKKDKSIRWIEDHKNSVFDDNGNFKLIYGIAYDITERKNDEEKLKEEEEKLKAIFNIAPVLIALTSPKDGRFVEANETLLRTLGYKRDELIGKTSKELNLFVDFDQRKSLFKELEKGVSLEGTPVEMRRKGGEVIVCSFYLSFVTVKGEKYILAVAQNITEREKIAKILKENEEKFRALFEGASDAIWMLDNGIVVDCNFKAIELFKCHDKSEMINRSPADFSPAKQPDGRTSKAAALDYIKKALNGETQRFYWQHKRDDGKLFDMEIALSRVILQGKAYLQAIGRDITKERELDQAKSDFLSLTSHQLRTPLSATKWVLETMTSDKNLNPKQKERFNDLVSSNERLINLVNDLLDVARIESGKLTVNKKLTDIKGLIESSVSSVRALEADKKKNIKISLPSGLKPVYCDPVLIHEAIENLLSNAINYSPEDSPEVRLVVLDRGDDYLVSVHNGGIVEPSAAGQNIFDKFVRGSKAPELQPSGSGLGLYLTKRVVEANGGTIWFESTPEAGTTFYFTIIKSKLKK